MEADPKSPRADSQPPVAGRDPAIQAFPWARSDSFQDVDARIKSGQGVRRPHWRALSSFSGSEKLYPRMTLSQG